MRKSRKAFRLELTLCYRCASDFRCDNRILKRVNPHKNLKSRCDICQVRFGYDYFVIEMNKEAKQ